MCECQENITPISIEGGLTQVQAQLKTNSAEMCEKKKKNISQRMSFRSLINGTLELKI